ncbi:MAG: PAS domain S-box protein [Candidatus Eremiobacteraeota bacterium]|nr:PAS domain S-box protein [Candidatus Eremiobacteraeota bacterium]MBV8722733.1 PAS domain S-box protein [Candidatus Eremiobacteraeota bacterium]
MKQFALMEMSPDAIVVVDGDGTIVFVNAQAERVFGYDRQELVRKGIEALVPERYRHRHVAHRAHYEADPRVRPMGADLELFGRRKDGSEFPVEISLSPVHTPHGVFTVSAIRDVTARKAVERELEEKNLALEHANGAKDRFLAAMSHELRTPLNAIIGFTGTLLMKLPGPLTPDQEQQLTIVASSARHLLSLINDILDVAKIESGKMEVFVESISVAQEVGDVAGALKSLATQKGLRLEVELPDGAAGLTLRTDRRAVHQILINLVNNAIKYTETGSVTVRANTAAIGGKQILALSVTDTGIGIPHDVRDRLFKPFEQLDPSNTRRFEGAGLGLYLCQKLSDMIGGSLSFESEPGAGSTFALTLPMEP